MSELNKDAGPSERPSAVSLRLALVVGTVVVGLAVIGLSSLGSGSNNPGPDPAESTAPATPKPGKYEGTDKLCQTIDRQRYEDVVGVKSEIEAEGTDIPPEEDSDSGTMGCDLGPASTAGPIRIHQLSIQADLYRDTAEAKVRYKEFIRNSSTDAKKMKPHNGSWERAVSYQKQDHELYVLVVWDDNITLTFRQTVNPFDAVESGDAVELMTDYAEQVLSALQK